MSALISYYTKLPEALEMAAKLAEDFDVLFVVNAKWDASPRPADLQGLFLTAAIPGKFDLRSPAWQFFSVVFIPEEVEDHG